MNPAMTQSGYELLLAALWSLAAVGMASWLISAGNQITYVTLADGSQAQRRLPLLFRAFLPLTANLEPLAGRAIFARQQAAYRWKLVAAGYGDLVTPRQLLSLQFLFALVVGSIVLTLLFLAVTASGLAALRSLQAPLSLLILLLLYIYPASWLRSELNKRHMSIRRALPFVLDLLTLSVEAGMDFMSALQRSLERGNLDALGEELVRVLREIQLGKTRREALRDMNERVRQPDLRSVVGALVQADELGVSIGSILRIQSDQIRQRRFDRAERLANEAPVKMLFPPHALHLPVRLPDPARARHYPPDQSGIVARGDQRHVADCL
jgi:tight adherence protein C